MAEKTKWSIDPSHSNISFKIKHLKIAYVKGAFKKYDSVIETSGKDFMTAKIDVTIYPSSIDTGDLKRDGHLISIDFFDVNEHPEIKFISKKISGKNGSFELWGDLTIKNITKQIKLNIDFGGIMKDPDSGNEKAGFTVAGKIDRTQWGLKWNSALDRGGMVLSDDVLINCEIELTNETEAGSKIKSKTVEEKMGIEP